MVDDILDGVTHVKDDTQNLEESVSVSGYFKAYIRESYDCMQ